MCSKSPDNSSDDESFVETDEVSRVSFDSSVNPDVNSSSDRNSVLSPSSSSLSPVSVCDHRDRDQFSRRRKRSNNDPDRSQSQSPIVGESGENEKITSNNRKINYDSISSLSVSSSPGKRSPVGVDNRRLLPVRITDQSQESQMPSFQQHQQNPLGHSQLIMPFPLFQSTIMSKMGSLTGIRDHYEQFGGGFYTDHNANNSGYADNNSPKRFLTIFEGKCEPQIKKLRSEESSTTTKRLSFGIDRILSDENSVPGSGCDDKRERDVKVISPLLPQHSSAEDQMTKLNSGDLQNLHNLRHPTLHHHNHNNGQLFSHNHHPSGLNLGRCAAADCYILSRYGRNNGSLQYPSLLLNSSGIGSGGNGNPISASFSPWSNASLYENSPLLSPSAYHQQSTLQSNYGMSASNFSTMSSLVACNSGSGGRRKRSWSRAVFSSLQRKGLEKRFQIQKYITKPDRRQLAATLGLTDAQVKVWFQNRRMKWRHSKEGKVTSGIGESISIAAPSSTTNCNSTTLADKK